MRFDVERTARANGQIVDWMHTRKIDMIREPAQD